MSWFRNGLAVSLILAAGCAAPSAQRLATGNPADGRTLYLRQCVTCHGAKLQGVQGPSLTGDEALTRWRGNGRTVGELYQAIYDRMPPTAAGSLSGGEAANLTAYILSANGFDPTATGLDRKMAP
jgi:cytochrome c